MKEEIEIEYKNLLSQKEYLDLLKSFSKIHDLNGWEQTNHYFDTENLDLKSKQAALRIRTFEKKRAEITLKTPFQKHLLERNETLTYQDAADMIQKGQIDLPKALSDSIKELGINPKTIRYQTSMMTYRSQFTDKQATVVLDKSSYMTGETDYELEVEGPSNEIAGFTFKDIMKKYDIKKRETKNKIERAFAFLEENA